MEIRKPALIMVGKLYCIHYSVNVFNAMIDHTCSSDAQYQTDYPKEFLCPLPLPPPFTLL